MMALLPVGLARAPLQAAAAVSRASLRDQAWQRRWRLLSRICRLLLRMLQLYMRLYCLLFLQLLLVRGSRKRACSRPVVRSGLRLQLKARFGWRAKRTWRQ